MPSEQIKVELQDSFGADRDIANAAWTSSLELQSKDSRTDEDVARVVKMLAELQHSVPFESIIFRFWIKMPIATDRQFCTHRIQSLSGMSGRYRTMPTEFLSITDDVKTIAEKVTSGLSSGYKMMCARVNRVYEESVSAAKEARDKGVITNEEYKRFREFYRGMLPQHNMTERVTTINLRSFANFIKLRLSEHAQPEIRQVAQMMLDEVKTKAKCPIAIEWLEKNGWRL